MAEENGMDPIHQFAIEPIVNLHLFGINASFTNSALFMVAIVALVTIFMMVGTSRRSLVPSRWQAMAEMTYEFVADTVQMSAGKAGMRFFPFIFSLFMFVLLANLIGLIPYTFSVTSQIVVTAALAILVISTVLLYGFFKHGLHFLKLFVPSGVSPFLLPFLVLIEVISFASRPISLSVRLFANILAGHITLKVMGGFVAALLGAGAFAILAPLPWVATVIFFALELLVGVLQAYVFAILSCVYLNDAIHPGH